MWIQWPFFMQIKKIGVRAPLYLVDVAFVRTPKLGQFMILQIKQNKSLDNLPKLTDLPELINISEVTNLFELTDMHVLHFVQISYVLLVFHVLHVFHV